MTQLALLPSPVERPHGIWSDIGRWMTGDGPRPDCLPATPNPAFEAAAALGTVRVVERPCGCQRRERMGAVGWLSAGRVRLCGEHRIWQEAT